jgi:3-oxoadipate enol-lactonase/4-carboxymuconolactone decarboxylase
MPFVERNGTRLFYRVEGREDRPVLVLSHSLGTDMSLWSPQMPALLDHFRVLRYDTRGHGASGVTPGDDSVEQLAHDALGLADALHIARFAFCGLSLGGMTGIWLAAHVPERLTRLVLANTSAKFGPPADWDARRKAVLEGGMAALAEAFVQRNFSPDTLATLHPRVDSMRSVFLGTDPVGYAGACAAIRDMDFLHLLPRIHTPTLLIVGDYDIPTPWSGHGEHLANAIADIKVVRLPAGHLSTLDRPRSFTSALLDFLIPSHPSDLLQAGLEVRRAALGADHVDRAFAATSDFNRDFQEMLTRFAWGSIWARPGLDHRTRRLLALSVLATLGRWEEFRVHVRAGLSHELEPCDLKEALMQLAIYAGVPAANTAFTIAREEMETARRHAQARS